jgi:hypothetical protein
MHGQQTGCVVYRELTIGTSFDAEVGRSCILFMKQIDAGLIGGFSISSE